MNRKSSSLDPAKFSHLAQQLAQNLNIGVAAVTHGLLGNQDPCAPTMCNPTSDCHPWPRFQLRYFNGLPGEVPLGPWRFLAIHGIYDDRQDSGIKSAQQEAEVPIHSEICVLILQMLAPQQCMVQLLLQRRPCSVCQLTQLEASLAVRMV